MLKSTGKTGFARLWELTAAEKPLVIISGVLSVAGVAASFLPYVAIYMIISHIVAAGGDVALTDKDTLLRYGLIALLSAAGAFIINLAGLIFSHAAAFNTLYRLRVGFVKHLATLPMGFHTRHPSGKLRKIMDENIEKLEGFIAHQLPDMIGTAAAPVIILIMLFAFDWRFGLAALVPVVLSYVILFSSFMGTEAAENLRKYQDALEDMNDSAVEYVRGMSVVKAFGQSVFSFRKFYNLIRTYTALCINYTNLFRNRIAGFLTIINNVYLFIMPLSIILLAGSSNYAETALASIFYIIFSLSLPAAFTKIMYVTNKGRIIADGIERMDKMLNTSPLPAPIYPQINIGCDVTFNNVSFEYHGESGDVLALKNISFTAGHGELTALVGPSGSGKSTIAHLIPRFFDVAEGSIRIGNTDIRDMSEKHLMSLVSFVFQDVFLFRQSIRENICIGRNDATEEEIIDAAKAAQCHDFIMKLPHGYDTVIGADGIHFSGGERQRIVIARAILKNAPIIVLDEATAFADPENEHKIQLAFETLMKDKTVIVIAHRLSSIRNADRIVVLDNGELIETGRHDELVAKNGRYSKMWEQYISTLSWRVA